jgi:hypothetical protein
MTSFSKVLKRYYKQTKQACLLLLIGLTKLTKQTNKKEAKVK